MKSWLGHFKLEVVGLSASSKSPDLGYLPNPLSLWDSRHGSATETPGHFLGTVSPSPCLSFFFKHILRASLQSQKSVFGKMVIALLGRDGMGLVPFCLQHRLMEPTPVTGNINKGYPVPTL